MPKFKYDILSNFQTMWVCVLMPPFRFSKSKNIFDKTRRWQKGKSSRYRLPIIPLLDPKAFFLLELIFFENSRSANCLFLQGNWIFHLCRKMAPLSLALHATCDLCTQWIGEETLKNIGVQSPKKRNSRTQEDIWKTASDSQWLKITLKCRILTNFVSTEKKYFINFSHFVLPPTGILLSRRTS